MAGKGRVAYAVKTGRTVADAAKPEENVAKLVEKMRRDPYVMLAERVLMGNVKAAKVTVSTTDPDPRARVLASTLEATWFRHLRRFTDAFAYGRVAFEIAWAGLPVLGINVVSQLIPLPYELSSMVLDKEGRFAGIEYGSGEDKDTLEPLYSWWLAIDAEPLFPAGKSRYQGAMEETWEERQDAITRRRTFLKKYALGDLVFEGPQFEDRDGRQVDLWSEFAASANSADAGDILFLDPGAEPDGDGGSRPKYKITKDPIPAKDGSPLITMTEQLGQEILLAAGIPPKTVVEGDAVGSFALVTQQMLILFSTVEDLLSQTGESYQQNVIDKAVALNDTGPIRWNYAPLTARKDDLATEIVRMWLTTPQLSPIVTSGTVDVLAMLDLAGVPVSSNAGQRLQAMIDAARVAAAAGPPQQAAFGAKLSTGDLWDRAWNQHLYGVSQ